MRKIYIDLADKLKNYIRIYNFKDGQRLSSEKKLAEEFGVNHLTVRKALALLEDENIIHKIPSKGSFVGKAPLSKHRNKLIGLLIPEKDPFFFDILIALEKHLALFNYGLIVQVSQRIPARETETLKFFATHDVDGIIAVPNRECAKLYKKLEIPTVFFDNMIDKLNIPYVLNDDFRAASDVVEYLISLGHRRIAHIGGHGDHSSLQRQRGYVTALMKHNIEIKENYIFSREYSREWGYAAGEELLSLPEDQIPTAVFCGNDSIASGFLRCLMTRNIPCPEQISVIGCCNAPFSEDIGLSTVDQDTENLTRMLWQTLQALINGNPAAPLVLMPSRLVIRRTTGAVNKSIL